MVKTLQYHGLLCRLTTDNSQACLSIDFYFPSHTCVFLLSFPMSFFQARDCNEVPWITSFLDSRSISCCCLTGEGEVIVLAAPRTMYQLAQRIARNSMTIWSA